MTQNTRNWLYNAAYFLDNIKRIKGKDNQMFVVFTHEGLEKFAADLRKAVADDEAEMLKRVHGSKGSHR